VKKPKAKVNYMVFMERQRQILYLALS